MGDDLHKVFLALSRWATKPHPKSTQEVAADIVDIFRRAPPSQDDVEAAREWCRNVELNRAKSDLDDDDIASLSALLSRTRDHQREKDAKVAEDWRYSSKPDHALGIAAAIRSDTGRE